MLFLISLNFNQLLHQLCYLASIQKKSFDLITKLTFIQRRWLDLKGRIKLAQPLHIPPRPGIHNYTP
jgi:hypothetical protein